MTGNGRRGRGIGETRRTATPSNLLQGPSEQAQSRVDPVGIEGAGAEYLPGLRSVPDREVRKRIRADAGTTGVLDDGLAASVPTTSRGWKGSGRQRHRPPHYGIRSVTVATSPPGGPDHGEERLGELRDEIAAADQRYTRFKAFQRGEVYNYDARMGARGGNAFLELGYLRPDLILKDLVSIAHPGLVPDHTLFFHRKLHPAPDH